MLPISNKKYKTHNANKVGRIIEVLNGSRHKIMYHHTFSSGLAGQVAVLDAFDLIWNTRHMHKGKHKHYQIKRFSLCSVYTP